MSELEHPTKCHFLETSGNSRNPWKQSRKTRPQPNYEYYHGIYGYDHYCFLDYEDECLYRRHSSVNPICNLEIFRCISIDTANWATTNDYSRRSKTFQQLGMIPSIYPALEPSKTAPASKHSQRAWTSTWREDEKGCATYRHKATRVYRAKRLDHHHIEQLRRVCCEVDRYPIVSYAFGNTPGTPFC